jgi:hypothetical protein
MKVPRMIQQMGHPDKGRQPGRMVAPPGGIGDALARIRPTQLGLRSFAVAIAHGAGLMLMPNYLGLCPADFDTGHEAAARLINANLGMAVQVYVAHSAAMIAAVRVS